MGVGVKGRGQILTFDFSGLAGNEASANSNSNHANLNSSTIIRGSGLSASANGDRFNATSWALTSIANAFSGNDYMEFTITPNLGYQFNISSIVVQWQRSETGNSAISLRSSIDNYTTDLDAIKNLADNASTQIITWTFTQSNTTSAVTYRFYSYAEGTSGSGGPGDGTGNDIEINGNVSIFSNDPMIGLNPNTLNEISYFFGEGPSAEQSFTVTGINLTNDINLSAPTNYEISKSSASGYTSLISYSPAEVSNPQTVYVRLKAGLAGGNYTGELITATSSGAETKTLTLNGRVKSVYAWTNTSGGSWTTSSNWNPTRTSPASDDRLLFNDGNTYTITDFASETIEGLFISNNTKVNLNSSSGGTLTIGNGSSGYDLIVESGCQLNISQSSTSALIISIGTDVTASISGSMDFASTQEASNQFKGTDALAITFQTGSIFTQNTNSTGYVFGNGTTGSVVFENGSSFIQAAGSNPFATTGGVVIFEQGSLFKIIASGVSTSFAGRSYSNFEMDYDGTISASNTTALSFDNLTITQGTFNLNSSGTPGHTIKGNITVASGASLNFNPSSAGTINLSGTSSQTISGGGTITSNAFSTLVASNAAGIVVDNNVSLNGNLTISDNSIVKVNPQKQLTVLGTLTNSEGAAGFMIESNATGTGSLLHNTAGVTATVERFVPAATWTDWKDGWHALSAPVYEQAIVDFTEVPASDYDFYTWYEDGSVWVNYKNTSEAPTWNTANILSNGLTNDAADFLVGKGYLVSYKNEVTKQFSGTLNTSDVAISGLNIAGDGTKGFHLLGNPYSCALLWDANWTKSNIAATAQVWSEALQDYAPLAYDSYIPAMNGFMVELTSDAASITIPSSKRAHHATSWYKNHNTIAQKLKLTVMTADGNSGKETIIQFDSASTTGFDTEFDGSYLQGYGPMFYSVSGENTLSVNTLPSLTNTTDIPLTFIKNNSDEFVLYAEGTETIPATIYLHDYQLGHVHDLSENPVYQFSSSDVDDQNRFKLTFGAVGISEKPVSDALKAYVVGDQLYFPLQGEASLEIIDLQGRILDRSKVIGYGLTSRAIHLPVGTYLVRLIGNQQVQTTKVFIK